jgi:hypothetical protein
MLPCMSDKSLMCYGSFDSGGVAGSLGKKNKVKSGGAERLIYVQA